ncbi:MAG TPA: response regulator [Nitrospira sp.]|nr:response regulator [Nitrospira sp.]
MEAAIFVTDDEATIRSAVIKRLSRRHHRVTGFDSGEALITALERQVPDLILLDLRMPGLSGLDTLKTVRPRCPRSLIIVLAAHPSVEEAVNAMKLGADDFVIKSVDLENLDHVVDRALVSRPREAC